MADTSTIDLLIYEASYRRIRDRLIGALSQIRPVLMHRDGSFSANGATIGQDQLRPRVSWANSDLYNDGLVEAFLQTILKLNSVEWMQSGFAGFDSPVFRLLAEKGIRLSNSNVQAPAMADYILGSVLEHFQDLDERRKAQANRSWLRVPFRELGGSTWLIIGYGNVGRETAKRARAFGAHILAVRRKVDSDDLVDEMGRLEDIQHFLPKADVVVLSCALNQQTSRLAGSEFLARMKEASVLVNVARGGLVDEAALLVALERGIPEYAILDVFDQEPLPRESPLWGHPRVSISAHASAYGSGNQKRGDELFLENLAHFVSGDPLVNEIDPAILIGERS